MIYLPVAPVENVQAANSSHGLTSERSQEFKSILDTLYRNDLKTREGAINDQKQQATKRRNKEASERKTRDFEARANLERQKSSTSNVVGYSRTNPGKSSKEGTPGSSASNEGTGSILHDTGTASNNSRTPDAVRSADVETVGADWSTVTPEAAAQIMASKTGVPAEIWAGVIYRESSNNPTIVNSIGCFGYLQLHPVHGASSTWTPEQYFDKAAELYATQGAAAWEAW
ncbi:hypothetical protein [Paraglaciecola chathamensis]|uniref:hypothetical protein n=1 Tax=Paraglaciecola chathamensis TaxID=368405 RepID=UPI003625DFD3